MTLPIIALAFAFSTGGATPCPSTPHRVDAATHVYGSDPEFEALDLYLPHGVKGGPLAIYIHGGAWVSRDKSEYVSLGQAFARCGIAAAVLNYPLAPQTDAEHQAADVARAFRWLVNHASAAGYDPKRIVLVGHSAGAQLALYALVSGAIPRGAVRGVVALGSVGINPSTDVADLDPSYQSIYDPAFGADRSGWRRFDIQPRLRGDEPPALVIHGRDDRMAPEAISAQLYEQLKTAGDRVEYLQPAGRDHWNMLDHMSEANDPTMQSVETFILKA